MLRIRDVELTQAIQYYGATYPGHAPDNSIPLVAGRPTVVRIFFDGATRNVAVTGFGEKLNADGSPAQQTFPATVDLVNVPVPPIRAEAGHSLNITIPAPASKGTWRLRLSIFEKPAAGVGAIASRQVDLSFVERAIVPIRLVRFAYRRPAVGTPVVEVPAPSVADFWSLAMGFIQHTWPAPLPVLCIARESVEVFDGIYDCSDGIFDGTNADASPRCFGNPGKDSPSARGTTGSISQILARLRMTEQLPSNVVYCALYPDQRGATGLPEGGIGGGRSFQTPNVIPGLMAHELGHALTLPHAPTPAFKNRVPPYQDADNTFPRYGALEWGSIGEVGFDALQPPAVDAPTVTPPGLVPPSTAYDVMGYDFPRWISPHHYLKLFAEVGAPGTGPSPCIQSLPPHRFDPFTPPIPRRFSCYFVEGLPGGDFIKRLCGPAVSVLIPFPRLEAGPIRVRVLDAFGATIYEDAAEIFTLSEPHDQPQRAFYISVPELDGAARLLVTHGDTIVEDSELVRRPVSFSAQAALIDPKARKVRVDWALAPEDSEAPVFVRASSDGGASFTAFHVPTFAKHLELDVASLPPGDSCVVEVLAGERLRTSQWRSDAIRVQTGRDGLIILGPRESRRVPYGEPIQLAATTVYGAGYESVIWSSDRDGDLGAGGHQVVRLSPGRHQLSARVGACGKRMKAAVVQVIAPRAARSTRGPARRGGAEGRRVADE